MTIRIDAESALRKLKRLTKQLTGRQLNTAVSRGINRSLLDIHAETIRAVKDEYNVPAKYLDRIKIAKATIASPVGGISISKKVLPLSAFSPKFEIQKRSIKINKSGTRKIKERQRKVTNPGKGVSIEVHRGSRKVIPFAFMIPTSYSVFARGRYRRGRRYGFMRRYSRSERTGSDIPISPLITLTVNAMVIYKKNMRRIGRKGKEVLPQYLTTELNKLIKKISQNQ